MMKTLTIIGFLAVFPAEPALADDDCFVPMADWQPRDAVARLADENGWTVRRIKIDDGCYEIDGRDVEGRQIEVTVHPGTLQVIEFEYEDEDEDDRHDQDWGRDREIGAGIAKETTMIDATTHDAPEKNTGTSGKVPSL